MARLDYIDRENLPPEHQDLLKRNINLFRLLVHSPGAARAFSGLGTYIRFGSKLDPRLRELAILQVGWCARSPYEWSHHVKIGYDFGVTDADIAALIADTAGEATTLSALDRLVLRAAREAHAGPGVGEGTFQALLAELGSECLTDLVITISFYCAVVRILASMQIDVEPSYMPYLEKYPLPAG
ncbi:MAG: carboxymuconolactone decarboxylase family protein [Alphaproteobacteria bacterium]|nr:carboxymuconolactone decarboxylase family protein [Alphaproteobacteria bacterium]